MDQEPPGSGMERGIILLPWDTQEEAVCSKMDQNGMIKAKMERIFRMCRVSSTAEVPQRCSAFFQPPWNRMMKRTFQKPGCPLFRAGGVLW